MGDELTPEQRKALQEEFIDEVMNRGRKIEGRTDAPNEVQEKQGKFLVKLGNWLGRMWAKSRGRKWNDVNLP